jgi:hypothetical protein
MEEVAGILVSIDLSEIHPQHLSVPDEWTHLGIRQGGVADSQPAGRGK